jgi:hypothetical protein
LLMLMDASPWTTFDKSRVLWNCQLHLQALMTPPKTGNCNELQDT